MTRREEVIGAIKAALADVYAPGEGRPIDILRDSGQAASRNVRYAATLDWQREKARRLTHQTDECDLTIILGVMMRSPARDDAALDEVIGLAHSALMADRTLGGVAHDTIYTDAMRETNDEEGVVNVIRHAYTVTYRRPAASMEAQ
jgi:hypothetical protein